MSAEDGILAVRTEDDGPAADGRDRAARAERTSRVNTPALDAPLSARPRIEDVDMPVDGSDPQLTVVGELDALDRLADVGESTVTGWKTESQARIVPSALPVTTSEPTSPVNAADVTQSRCPARSNSGCRCRRGAVRSRPSLP